MSDPPSTPGERPFNDALPRDRITQALTRGAARMLFEMGFASLTEFTLKSGRRADLIGMDAKGTIAIVEVKSSLEDFRSDGKWPEYLDFCDHFYFAVPEFFPLEVLPEDMGLLVADPFGAAVVREAPVARLNAARRRSILLKFALTAARRLGDWEPAPP
jgi:hypothetical protein